MYKIFETLYESVSEACFEDIMSMVEEYISEVSKDFIGPKLERAEQKRKENQEETTGILKDPDRSEEEKDRAALENAKYNCKVTNTTNKAFEYIKKK